MSDFLKSTKEKVIRNVALVAKQGIKEPNYWGWPPSCMGILYQAKRPKELRKDDKFDNSKLGK